MPTYLPSFLLPAPSSRPASPREHQRTCGHMCTLSPRPHLVLITPQDICASPRRAADLASAAVAGGVSIVQLRDHRASFESLRETASCLSAALPSPAHLVVNGPFAAKIAAEIGGGVGVHLREADATERNLERARSAGGLVGVSVHAVDAARSVAGIMERRECDGYLQVGTMFATGSHPGKVPEGVGLMCAVREAVGDGLFLVGVGGLTRENIPEVIGVGKADGVAVISGIAAAEIPESAARKLRRAVDAAICR